MDFEKAEALCYVTDKNKLSCSDKEILLKHAKNGLTMPKDGKLTIKAGPMMKFDAPKTEAKKAEEDNNAKIDA